MSSLYDLIRWAWDNQLDDRARWVAEHRPFIGYNPALERVTDG